MQWLGLLILTAKGQDSTPVWETKILQKKKKIMAFLGYKGLERLHVFLLKLSLFYIFNTMKMFFIFLYLTVYC